MKLTTAEEVLEWARGMGPASNIHWVDGRATAERLALGQRVLEIVEYRAAACRVEETGFCDEDVCEDILDEAKKAGPK